MVKAKVVHRAYLTDFCMTKMIGILIGMEIEEIKAKEFNEK